jgi:hypothetical protein
LHEVRSTPLAQAAARNGAVRERNGAVRERNGAVRERVDQGVQGS